jgi:NAD(P)-dependent dehydrogenase (short-subunit alcohol dehydrogenase family)
MSDSGNRLVSFGAAKNARIDHDRPRVLITGACHGVGRACAELLFSSGAELILFDKDAASLTEIADTFEADARLCNVASEAEVLMTAADVIDQHGSLDMVINAAGGGYERTLGMYRMSRALFPALCQGKHKLLVNVPPTVEEGNEAIFPYASSKLAFHRLCGALAHEARGTSLAVLIGCAATGRLTRALPDPDAGTWAKTSNVGAANPANFRKLAWHIASLVDGHVADHRRAS